MCYNVRQALAFRLMKQQNQPRARNVVIAVQMSTAVGRIRLEGILRFLRRERDWRIKLIETGDRFSSATIAAALEDGIDGFIVFQDLDRAIWQTLTDSGIPVISLESLYPPELPHGAALRLVRADDEGLGRLAARHLLSVGNFRAFVFVPSPDDTRWSLRRETGYRAALAAAGHDCMVLPSARLLREESETPLQDWLLKLPRPFALFAANDFLATRVLTACRTTKIDVPHQAAVLGADDDEIFCSHATPRLSSIRFVTERQGEIVARELEKMMNGRPRGACILPWTHHALVPRESTAPIAPAAQLIRRALALIDRQATRGLGVNELAHELGVSRRLLELRFSQFERRTAAEALDDRRFEELVRRLEETDEPIARIAASCGFRDLSSLTRRFRKRYGKTMRDWRTDALNADC